MFRYSSPEPIPSDHLRRITDSCAYFFYEHIFGVTTNGGTSWSIKGGTDKSNAHNRAGEAEKSHQKARQQDFRECWTLIYKKGLDEAKANGWTVVSMRDDWIKVYP